MVLKSTGWPVRRTRHSNWLARNYSESTVLHVSTLHIGTSLAGKTWSLRTTCLPFTDCHNFIQFLGISCFDLWNVKKIGMQIGDSSTEWSLIEPKVLKPQELRGYLLCCPSFRTFSTKSINPKQNTYFKTRKKSASRNEESHEFCDDLAAIIDSMGWGHEPQRTIRWNVDDLRLSLRKLVGRRPRTFYRHILSFCYIETSAPRLARELLVSCLRVGHIHLAKSITFFFISWTCGFKFWNCRKTIQKNWKKPIRMMTQDYCFISMGKWMVNHVLFCMLHPPGPQRAKRMSQPPRMDMI